MGTSLKNKYAYWIVYVISMYLVAVAVLVGVDIHQNRMFLSKDAYFKSHTFKNQLIVYNERVRTSNGLNKNEDDSLLKNANKYLTMEQSMKYYIKNKDNGDIFTNIDRNNNIEEYIRKNGVYVEKFPQNIDYDWEYEDMNSWFHKSNMEGTFIFIDTKDNYSQIKKDYMYYNSISNRLKKELKLAAICLSISGIIIFCIKRVSKNKNQSMSFTEKYERIPLDLRVFIFIISTFFIKSYIEGVKFFYKPINFTHFKVLTETTLCIIFLVINIKSMINIVVRKEQRMYQWQHSIIFKIKELKGESNVCKSIIKKEIKLFIYTIIFGISLAVCLFGVLVSFPPIVLIALGYIVVYLIFIPKKILDRIHDINSIVMGTDHIVNGKLDSSINNLSNSEFTHIAENINNIQQIYKESTEAKIKSERMKTELITNVSHDLKTPLTSIINYVTLLKNSNSTEEEKKKYVEVLNKKSHRLKILIDDLFEAAKASSGTIDMIQEKVDISMLLNQALGELEDKIAETTLTFRVNIPEKPVYVNLDGRRTWRVFENIIGNALKYSQCDSRVYVDLNTKDNNAIITVKNVSNYEMNFEVSEIFERFKRGDKSRSTEGSGLGVSIAKSFVELQGGQMDIEIDGDLFKVIISFPIIN